MGIFKKRKEIMAERKTGVKDSSSIDPALKARLEERGMTDRIKDISYKKPSSTIKEIPGAAKEMFEAAKGFKVPKVLGAVLNINNMDELEAGAQKREDEINSVINDKLKNTTDKNEKSSLLNVQQYMMNRPSVSEMALSEVPVKPDKTNSTRSERFSSVVGDILPGGKLGIGSGYALSVGYVKKQEKEAVKQGQQLEDVINSKIRTAGSSEEKSKYLNLKKEIQSFEYGASSISEFALEDSPSDRQILMSSAELALLTVAGYRPGLSGSGVSGSLTRAGKLKEISAFQKQISGFNNAEKLRNSSKFTKDLNKIYNSKKFQSLSRTVANTALDSTMFALNEGAIKRDATIDDIIKSGETGLKISSILNVTTHGASRLIGGANKYLKPGLNTFRDDMITELKKIADDNYDVKKLRGKDPLENMANNYVKRRGFIKKLAQKTAKVLENSKNFTTNFLDRTDPLKRIDDTLYENLGINVSDDTQKIQRDAQLIDYVSNNDSVKRLEKFSVDMKPYRSVVESEELEKYLVNLDMIDRGRLGNDLVNGWELDEALINLKEMQKKLGPDKMKMIGEAKKVLNDYHIKLLEDRVSAGLLTREYVDTLKKVHPNYIPHNIMRATDDELDVFKGISDSLNLSKTDVIETKGGSKKKIQSPLDAMAERTLYADRTINKNKLMNNIMNAQKQFNVLGDEAYPLLTAEQQIKRKGLVSEIKAVKETREILTKEFKPDKNTTDKLKKLNKEYNKQFEKYSIEFNEGDYAPSVRKQFNELKIKEQKLNDKLSKLTKMSKDFSNENIMKVDKKIADKSKKAIPNKEKVLNTINKLKDDYLKGIDEFDDLLGGLRSELKETVAKKAKRGEEVVSFFNKGFKEQWVVPKDIAYVIKNTDAEISNGLLKIVEAANNKMKKFSTSENLSFIIPNLFRDQQTAAINAGAMIEDIAMKTGVSPVDIGATAPDILDSYFNNGSFSGSILQDGDSAYLKKLEKKGIVDVVKSGNPIKIIEKINENFERFTRRGVYKKALERGLSEKDALYVAANATVDFNKMGEKMKSLNKMIPFLNARVQGFVNIAKTLKNNPAMFARMQMYTAVYPTMVLQTHNSAYESYKNISQYFKNKHWIIMTGEEETNDPYSGNKITVPQFVTIPKGEGQALVSGPIQYYLDKASNIDKRSVNEMMIDVLGSASPVSFQSFDQSNAVSSALSQLGPLPSIGAGLATNKNLYYGTDIIPQSKKGGFKDDEVSRNTDNIIKDVTNKFNKTFFKGEEGKGSTKGVAPAQTQFVLESFGGLSKDTIDLVDLLYSKLTDQDVNRENLTGTPHGKMSVSPVTRSIIREDRGFGTSDMEKKRRDLEVIKKEEKSIDIKASEYSNEIVSNMIKMGPEERVNYITSLKNSGNIDKDTYNSVKKKFKTRRSVDVLTSSVDNEVKAKFIAKEAANMNDEEMGEYFQDLKDAGILTKDLYNDAIMYSNQDAYDLYNNIKGMNDNEINQYIGDLKKKKLINKDLYDRMKDIKRYDDMKEGILEPENYE